MPRVVSPAQRRNLAWRFWVLKAVCPPRRSTPLTPISGDTEAACFGTGGEVGGLGAGNVYAAGPGWVQAALLAPCGTGNACEGKDALRRPSGALLGHGLPSAPGPSVAAVSQGARHIEFPVAPYVVMTIASRLPTSVSQARHCLCGSGTPHCPQP